jgi:hypothetical protein
MHEISNRFDGGSALQQLQKHVFNQSGIRQRAVLTTSGNMQPDGYVLQTVARPYRVQLACELERVK